VFNSNYITVGEDVIIQLSKKLLRVQ
jgi:hypothetical protein